LQVTASLDDDLLHAALEITGETDRTALLREALKALIHMEASCRLAMAGDTESELKNHP
jgi:hypothetical protein